MVNTVKKYVLLIASMLLLFTFNEKSISQDRFTQFKLTGGIYLNGNIYFSDFKELKGYPTCCQKFDFATGLGYGAFFGSEYVFEEQLYGFISSADLLISYQNLTADYTIEENIGNIITGNTYEKGIALHSLNPVIHSVLLIPGINIYPVRELPLSIRLGLEFGIPFGMTFTQQEKIISPSWLKYEETNSNIRYSYAGDIPEAASIYSAISIGLKYEVYELGDFKISPLLNFNYGLTNIASGLDWSASAIQLGVAFDYRIPQTKLEPPQDAPLPILPEPPLGENILIALSVKIKDKELKSGDSVSIPVYDRKFINKFMLMPVVFYKVNTSEMVLPGQKLRTEEKVQHTSYQSALQYLQNHNDVKVTLVSTFLNTENSDTVKLRVGNLKQYFKENGINENRISVKEQIKKAADMGKAEQLEDNCLIRFDFSDNLKVLPFWNDTSSRRIIGSLDFDVAPNVSGGIDPVEITGGFYVRGNKVFDLQSNPMVFTMQENILKWQKELMPFELEIKATAKDGIRREASTNFHIMLKPEIIDDGILENVISDIEQPNYVQQLLLAYCEFDRAELYAENKEAAETIRKAYKQGMAIEIIPLFDFLGTPEHNEILANERANSALKLLGLKREDVTITIPKDYFFSNDEPYGRMMNRAVIVRIKDIRGE